MSNVYEDYKVPQTGLYHKFEDGVVTTFRLLTEPVVYESTYTNQDGEDIISTKYSWLAYDVEAEQIKVLNLPMTAYKQIAALARDEDYGDPTQYNLKLSRTGTGPSTAYTVTPSPKKSDPMTLSETIKEDLAELDLKAITAKGKGVAHVNYLSEVIAVGNKHVVKEAPKDVVIEDIEDGPLDLSKIPF